MVEIGTSQERLLDYLTQRDRMPELILDFGLDVSVLKDNIRNRATVLMDRLGALREVAPDVYLDSQRVSSLRRELLELKRNQFSPEKRLTGDINLKEVQSAEIEAKYAADGVNAGQRLIFYAAYGDMLELDGILIDKDV